MWREVEEGIVEWWLEYKEARERWSMERGRSECDLVVEEIEEVVE